MASAKFNIYTGRTQAERLQDEALNRACFEKVLEKCSPFRSGVNAVRGYVEMTECFWCHRQTPAVIGWPCPHCGKKQPQANMDQSDEGSAE